MKFNPKAKVDQSQYRDAGGSGRSGSRMSGFPIPMGRGGLSIGSLVAALVIYLITQYAGGDGDGGSAGTADGTTCRTGADANASKKCELALFATSVNDFWEKEYPAQTGKPYEPAVLTTFVGATDTGCGTGQEGMGPFYCPNDQGVYVAESFATQMLEGQLGARGGPFATGYVVAHEYGHHLENLLGVLGQIRTQRGPKSDSVRAELMADCLGGVWARGAQDTVDEDGVAIIEELTEDDVARAIDAASAVGDDKLGAAQENWSHGSSTQRVRWFTVGLEKGSIEACDTFAPGAL